MGKTPNPREMAKSKPRAGPSPTFLALVIAISVIVALVLYRISELTMPTEFTP